MELTEFINKLIEKGTLKNERDLLKGKGLASLNFKRDSELLGSSVKSNEVSSSIRQNKNMKKIANQQKRSVNYKSPYSNFISGVLRYRRELILRATPYLVKFRKFTIVIRMKRLDRF